MTHTAEGEFTLHWGEEPAFDDAPGARLHRVTVTKDWTGDITGSSVAHLITAMSPVTDSAGYVGIERLDVSVAGRTGTMVVQHSAISSAQGRRDLVVQTLPDTATGELEGIQGLMKVTITEDRRHLYTFTYDLPE